MSPTDSEVDRQRRESVAGYPAILNAMDEGYVLADVLLDGAGRMADMAYVEANRLLCQQAITASPARRPDRKDCHWPML